MTELHPILSGLPCGKATPERPRIVRSPNYCDRPWACGAINGKGRFAFATGASQAEAYSNFQTSLESLRRAGLYWEVFP